MSELAHVLHDGTGPPALFVHGYLTGGVYWQANLPALSKVCRPVVIDLWGHDASPSPAEEAHYDPAGVVASFERLRRRLGFDRWFVIGHSLGAALSMHYALAHPNVVQGLVITNSNSGFAHADEERRIAAAKQLATRIDERGMAAFETHPLNPSVSKRLPDEARTLLVDAFERHDPIGLANTLRWTTPRAAVVDRLQQLGVPTLLTWGVFEKKFQPGAALAQERIADLRVAELQGGHPVNLQDQPGFDEAVARFMISLS